MKRTLLILLIGIVIISGCTQTKSPNQNQPTNETKDIINNSIKQEVIVLPEKIILDVTKDENSYCVGDICISFFSLEEKPSSFEIELGEFTQLNTVKLNNNFPQDVTIAYTTSKPKEFCRFVTTDDFYDFLIDREDIYSEICNRSGKYEEVVGDALYEKYVVIFASLEDDTIGLYLGNGIIILDSYLANYAYMRDVKKTFYHELVHSAFEDAHLPVWLNEGIAEYLGMYMVAESPGYVVPIDGLIYLNSKIFYEHDDDVYGYTAYVVRRFAEVYGDDTLKQLITQLRSQLKSNQSIQTKNLIVLKNIKNVTGNKTITFNDILKPEPTLPDIINNEELFNEYCISGDFYQEHMKDCNWWM